MKSKHIAFLLAALCASAAPFADAQTPSYDDMVNSLAKPPTGGSRQFHVQQDDAGPAPDAAPSDSAPSGKPATRSGGKARGKTHHVVAEAPARAQIGVPLLFDTNSATLRPESTPALEIMAKVMKDPKLASAKFLLEGHTDASGEAAHNLQLSAERAEAVKTALVQNGGIDPARLSTSGKGQADLANPSDPLGAENRRVVVVNLSSE